MGGSAFIEDEGLSHTNPSWVAKYDLVTAGGLPESGRRGPIRACSGWVLLVFVAEEVPIILWSGSDFTFLCKNNI